MLALLLVSAASVTARAAAAVEPSPGVSNVVFMLIKGIPSKHEITQMVLRQACIDSALGGGHAAVDSVIFHEKPIPEASKKALMAALPSIKLVDARSYGGFQPSTFNMSILTDNDYSLGYRQMCHFHSMVWFKALANYEYAMRVDDDVCLQRLNSDPFAAMREGGYTYAYGAEVEEKHEETRKTMDPWLERYSSSHALPSVSVESILFSNFFVSAVKWWSSPDVKSFLQEIEASGNIYRHRWGDAPIQTAALRLLAAPNKLLNLRSDYLHLSTSDILRGGQMVDSDEDEWGRLRVHPFVSHFRRQLEHNGTSPNGTVPAILRNSDTYTTELGNVLQIEIVTPNDGMGPYPLMIFLSATGFSHEVSLIFLGGALELPSTAGYVTALIEYPDVDTFPGLDCAEFQRKARAVFSGPDSALDKLCSRPNIDCSLGVGVAGVSQGAAIGLLSPTMDERISAVVAISYGSLPGCIDSAAISPYLPPENRLSIISEDDEYFGGDYFINSSREGVIKQQREQTGIFSCELDCVRNDGSGYFIVENIPKSPLMDSVHSSLFLQVLFGSSERWHWPQLSEWLTETAKVQKRSGYSSSLRRWWRNGGRKIFWRSLPDSQKDKWIGAWRNSWRDSWMDRWGTVWRDWWRDWWF